MTLLSFRGYALKAENIWKSTTIAGIGLMYGQDDDDKAVGLLIGPIIISINKKIQNNV